MLEGLLDLLRPQRRKYIDLIIAEEIRHIEEERELGLQGRVTKVLSKSLRLADSGKNVLLLNGRGLVREIALVSDSPKYKVEIHADGEEIVSDWFENLETTSEYVDTITAIYDRGKGAYVFGMEDISFMESFRFDLLKGNVSVVNFQKVYVIYELAEG